MKKTSVFYNLLAAMIPSQEPLSVETVENSKSNKRLVSEAEYSDTCSSCHQIKDLLFENGYSQGLAFIGKKKYPQALNEFDQLLTHEPDNPRFHLQRGICLKHLERYEEALPALFTALTHDPQNNVAVKNIAACYLSLRQKQASVWWYEHATSLGPHDPDVWHGLGECYASLKREKEAVGSYKKEFDLIASLRDDMVHKKQSRFCSSSELGQINEYMVRLVDLSNYIGRYYFEIGRIDEAKKHLSQAISAWADTWKFMTQHNLKWIGPGTSPSESNMLKLPVKQKKTLVSALITLADCHLQDKQITEASDCFKTILNIEQSDKNVRERAQEMLEGLNALSIKSKD